MEKAYERIREIAEVNGYPELDSYALIEFYNRSRARDGRVDGDELFDDLGKVGRILACMDVDQETFNMLRDFRMRTGAGKALFDEGTPLTDESGPFMAQTRLILDANYRHRISMVYQGIKPALDAFVEGG